MQTLSFECTLTAIVLCFMNISMLQEQPHNFKFNKNFYSLTQMSTYLVSNDLNSI